MINTMWSIYLHWRKEWDNNNRKLKPASYQCLITSFIDKNGDGIK